MPNRNRSTTLIYKRKDNSPIINFADWVKTGVRKVRNITINDLFQYVINPEKCFPMALILWIIEIVINTFIIQNVKYTEIDWIAYMQEVEGIFFKNKVMLK